MLSLVMIGAGIGIGAVIWSGGSGGSSAPTVSTAGSAAPVRNAVPSPPPGSTTAIGFSDGKVELYIWNDERTHRLYAGAIYDGRDTACGDPDLTPDYNKPLPYISSEGSFLLIGGRWERGRTALSTGSASGKFSPDGNSVTISWRAYVHPISRCGTAASNLVLTRLP